MLDFIWLSKFTDFFFISHELLQPLQCKLIVMLQPENINGSKWLYLMSPETNQHPVNKQVCLLTCSPFPLHKYFNTFQSFKVARLAFCSSLYSFFLHICSPFYCPFHSSLSSCPLLCTYTLTSRLCPGCRGQVHTQPVSVSNTTTPE